MKLENSPWTPSCNQPFTKLLNTAGATFQKVQAEYAARKMLWDSTPHLHSFTLVSSPSPFLALGDGEVKSGREDWGRELIWFTARE
jgi:hypothetical protein